mgnify:CR=1 FL=1
MSWKDKLLDASFRGVPFQISSHEMETGRRGVQHEYVQRDKPFTEDTGRKGKQYSFDAYILGTDYFEPRDALIKALETEGPGELVHPFYGRVFVQALNVRVRETAADGGMVTFSLTFVEAGESAFPAGAVDNKQVLLDKTEDFLDKVNQAFAKVFSVADKPQYVVDSAVKKINSVTDAINAQVAKVGDAQQKVAETNKRIQELRDKVEDFVHTPEKLASKIQDALRGLQGSIGNARNQFDSLATMFGFGKDDVPVAPVTATRVTEQQNNDAVNFLVVASTIPLAAQSAVEITYESTEDAGEIRAELVESLEELELDPMVDDETFQIMYDTKAEVIKSVPPPSEQLPTIGEAKLLQTMPSLVVTYDLYENPIYEDDLIARNKISHPGFVPGGKELEVLQVE